MSRMMPDPDGPAFRRMVVDSLSEDSPVLPTGYYDTTVDASGDVPLPRCGDQYDTHEYLTHTEMRQLHDALPHLEVFQELAGTKDESCQ